MPVNGEAALVGRESLTEDYSLLTFHGPEIAREARPGQFVMMKADTRVDLPLRRPFSLLSVDRARETFSLFVKRVGPGSRTLSALAPGDRASCLGPLGRPFDLPPAGRRALLVAGGYGVAPLIFLARELACAGHTAELFYGARRAADLPLAPLCETLGVPVHFATEDGSRGHTGLVTACLEGHLDALAEPSTLYACGPKALLRAVGRMAQARRLPAQLSLDPWMGCGIGICLSCVVRLRRKGDARSSYRCACTEGPVFDADEIVWEEAVEEARA